MNINNINGFAALLFSIVTFFIQCNYASANNAEGVARIIDVNNSFNHHVYNQHYGLSKIKNGIISPSYNYQTGAQPWIFKHGSTSPELMFKPVNQFILPNGTVSKNIRTSVKINENQIIFSQLGYPREGSLNAITYWISDGTLIGTKPLNVFDKIDEYIAANFLPGGSKNFWAGRLENGLIIIKYNGLWSYNSDSDELIMLKSPLHFYSSYHDQDGKFVYFLDVFSSLLHITDGTLEGTKEILDLSTETIPEVRNRRYKLLGSGEGSNYKSYSSNAFYKSIKTPEGIYIFKQIKNGKVVDIYSNTIGPVKIETGIAENDDSIFFRGPESILKYDKKTKIVETLISDNDFIEENPDYKEVIDDYVLHKIIANKLLISVQKADIAYTTGWVEIYSIDLSSKTTKIKNITYKDEGLLYNTYFLVSDGKSIYFKTLFHNKSDEALLKYIPENDQFVKVIDSVHTNFSGGNYFIHDGALYLNGQTSVVRSQNSSSIQTGGVYLIDEKLNNFKLIFTSNKNRFTTSSHIRFFKNHKEKVYFQATQAHYNDLDRENERVEIDGLYTLVDNVPKLIVEGWINDGTNNQILSADKLYFKARTNTGMHTYAYDEITGLELLYSEPTDASDFRELKGYIDGKLVVKSYEDEGFLSYLDVKIGILSPLDFSPKYNAKVFSCGKNLFLSESPKLYNITANSVELIGNIPTAQISENFIFYGETNEDKNLVIWKLFDCQSFESEVVLETPSYLVSYKTEEINHDTFLVFMHVLDDSASSKVYKISASEDKIESLSVENMGAGYFEYLISTHEGTYFFENRDVFKLVDGGMEKIVSDHKYPIDHFRAKYSMEDKRGLIFFPYIKRLGGDDGLVIYDPLTNEFYDLDINPDGYFKLEKFKFIDGKYYFEYYHVKLGLEMFEISQSCLIEKIIEGNSCSTALTNQKPIVAAVKDLNHTHYQGNDYFYTFIRAIDADFDKLSYQLLGAEDWLKINDLGEISGFVPADENTNANLQVIISDGENEVYTNVFNINTNVNDSDDSNETDDSSKADSNTEADNTSEVDSDTKSSSGGAIGALLIFIFCILYFNFIKNHEPADLSGM